LVSWSRPKAYFDSNSWKRATAAARVEIDVAVRVEIDVAVVGAELFIRVEWKSSPIFNYYSY
jgi:hypothetical protein